ncbi:hypothetical protein KVR01_012010 [Diaporthe batatas]|uniref:uncharacterized protein n=1 Tax=Diaporthe batatas TaxID=748121 RepID=UPI001D0499E5|nr:uncharacterized protein KVR01_012010 [Diaporthe batatas]KAG8158249.1 hypothetical protein KVR01_012010 [Diaporthe batatas]
MASHRPRSISLPPTWSHFSRPWPHEYSPLTGSRTIRLLFLEPQSLDHTRHFITGRLEVVNLEDFERRYVALSYTWGPAIREGSAEPDDTSRIIPPCELLIATNQKKCSLDDCHLGEEPGSTPKHAPDYSSIELAPNLSDYFTYHAAWHIKQRVPLWIDAICINQQDPAEVAEQILLQADIYTMARQTNVWLGACQKDMSKFQWWHDTVYQALVQERSRHRQSPYILDLIFKTGDLLNPQFWLDNFNLSPPSGSTWNDLWRSYVDFFFARRWFSRLWTIQEVMLAQKVYMLCGPRLFNFSDVLNLDRWLLSSFFRAKQNPDPNGGGQDEPVWPRWNPGYIFEIIRTRINHVQLQAFASDTTTTRDEVSSVRLSYLLGILQCARGQETTFPRDKVLGLLGVATRFVPKNKVQLLVRDLGGSDRDVFVSFARYYVHRRCLDILSYAGHRHGGSAQGAFWPSWVPNWDDVSQSGFHEFSSSGGEGQSFAGRHDTGAPQNPAISDEDYRGRLDGCLPRAVGETLHLYGVRIGVIAEAYAKDEWTRNIKSLLTILGSRYCLTGEPIQRALLGTIFRIADDSPGSLRSRLDDIAQFMQYLLTKLILHGRTNSHFAEDLAALLTSQPSMHTDLSSTIRDALAVINELAGTEASVNSPADSRIGIPTYYHGSTHAAHQSFSIEVEVMQKIFNIFVTGEGVLGNGSKSIRPGDEIWVVRNGPVPLVLERDVDGGQRFRLVSTAYVHGVRYDEVFTGKTAEDMTELRII